MRNLLLSCLLFGVAAACVAQDNRFEKVQIKIQHVAGSVYMLEGEGGNIAASVGNDGIVMIDDQFAPLAPKIKAALKSISDKPIRFVINTHWHRDHVGGNAQFAGGSAIIAQQNVRNRMMEGGTIAGREVQPYPHDALPIITFDDRISIYLNGENIRAIHFPKGHTDGDTVVYFTKSNVIHMGDDFVTYGFPFVDLDSGGTVEGMISAVEKVIATAPPDAKIIPGHGPLSTVADMKPYLRMLRETRDKVAAGIKQGKTLDQLKREKVLAGYEKWNNNFVTTEKWIDTLYRDLTSQKPESRKRN